MLDRIIKIVYCIDKERQNKMTGANLTTKKTTERTAGVTPRRSISGGSALLSLEGDMKTIRITQKRNTDDESGEHYNMLCDDGAKFNLVKWL